MPDIIRSMMIFKLEENYSKEELQKSYKKLVKKYHPDSNPKNQDWSHQKMTEINLAYEVCSQHLATKNNFNQEISNNTPKKQENEPFFDNNGNTHSKNKNKTTYSSHISNRTKTRLSELTDNFTVACERFFEYGLENRKLRNEGVRRFRYRESIRLFDANFSKSFSLDQYCSSDFDRHIVNLYIRFSGNFYQYTLLDEKDIPRHPLLNRHWQTMEDYLLQSLKDYLVPHLVRNSKVHWKTSFTHCWNHLLYLKNRFHELEKDEIFLIFYNLADSYRCIRKEEIETGILFFR